MSDVVGLTIPEAPGPQDVPYVQCGGCGAEHHPDYVSGEYQGQCRECGDFLRRLTDAEWNRFTAFIKWNAMWLEIERGGDGE